jgi:hypothetical protein
MVWLPDSSGFVYPAGKEREQLCFYDAATQKHRLLVADTGAATIIPALSPDGKQIAVARIRSGGNPAGTAQVLIYDRDGKEVHRSPEIVWNKADPKDKDRQTVDAMLFWDAAGKKLLVSDIANKEESIRTGIYDPTTKKMRVIDGQLLAFGTTPIRPDGKGFLVLYGPEQWDIALVDWEGKRQKIVLPPETTDEEYKQEILAYPWWFASRWEGDVASVAYQESRIRLDTKTLKAKLEKRPAAEARVGDFFLQHQHTFAGGVKVRALVHEDEEGKQNKSRLEIITPGKEKPRALVEQGNGLFGFSPSPDKKLLAIWCVDDGTKNPRIYVVNSSGEIVSETTPKED